MLTKLQLIVPLNILAQSWENKDTCSEVMSNFTELVDGSWMLLRSSLIVERYIYLLIDLFDS
jgi:hypothetical protein